MELGVVNPESEWNIKWPWNRPQAKKANAPRHNIMGSPAMRCGKFKKKIKGKKVTKIIDKYATNNDKWARQFLKGTHNRLPLSKCLILDISLSNIAYSLPSEVKSFKSWQQFSFCGIQFYSNRYSNFKKNF